MKLSRKLAALCAVFLLSLCFFSTVAYAEETPPPAVPVEETEQPATVEETEPPTVTESIIEPPTESAVEPEETVETVDIALPDGTGTVIDVFSGEDGRKFYTIATPAGNVFYLVIDFNRQTDNVYFLDAVTERDLLALAEKSGNTNPGDSVSAIPGTETNDNPAPAPTPGNDAEPQPEEKNDNNMSSMILVVAVVVIGGGAAWYFKVYRKRKDADIRDEYEPEDYPVSEYETEQEDDSVPWEDDEA